MTILISLLISSVALTENLRFDVKFPPTYKLELKSGLYKPEVKLEDKKLVAFTGSGLTDLTTIYVTYKALAQKYPQLMQDISLKNEKYALLETKVLSLEDSLLKVEYGLETCREGRKLLMGMYEESAKNYEKEIRKKKIRTILIGVGSGAAGVGVGLILGLIVFR